MMGPSQDRVLDLFLPNLKYRHTMFKAHFTIGKTELPVFLKIFSQTWQPVLKAKELCLVED